MIFTLSTKAKLAKSYAYFICLPVGCKAVPLTIGLTVVVGTVVVVVVGAQVGSVPGLSHLGPKRVSSITKNSLYGDLLITLEYASTNSRRNRLLSVANISTYK